MKNQVFKIIVILVVGILIGKFFLVKNEKTVLNTELTSSSKIWTCSMHPQIQQKEFGLCPICAMDLTPLEGGEGAKNNVNFQLKQEAIALSNIQTSKVKYAKSKNKIMLSGKVVADERRVSSQNAHFSGRVEKLYINFTGEKVVKGQKIAAIYSSELVTAQQELLEAHKSKNQELIDASKRKIKYWKLSDLQIENIINSQKVQPYIDILSEFDGVVMQKMINIGSHIMKGKPIFKITNFDKVWVVFDAYEQHLGSLKLGADLKVSFDNAKNIKSVKTKISFISPLIDAKSRVVKVRAELKNKGGHILPEMIITAEVYSPVNQNITIPKTAVLWTGKHSYVYVSNVNNRKYDFEIREVELGKSIGDSYVINTGLEEGENVVTNGVFTVDAAAQLQGKKSMMNTHVVDDRDFYKKVKRVYSLAKFQNQIEPLYQQYLKLSHYLVHTKANDVKKTTEILLKITKGKFVEQLQEYIKKIQDQAKNMLAKNDIENQRKYFTELSNYMLVLVKSVGIKNQVYIQYCPMANKDTGGYWLSDKQEILNPYFGDKMMHCGLVKEIIK